MKKALIVVDVQNDFCKNGSLEVPNANEIISGINRLIKQYLKKDDLVIFTQDWHPENHKSFVSQWKGKNVFDVVDLNGINQVLWPIHCIQYTKGSDFHPDLYIDENIKIFTKGENTEVDSYSGFYDNDHKTSTDLSKFLKQEGVEIVEICGLATDFCVRYTAEDAVKEGFETYLLKDLSRGIGNDIAEVYNELNKLGIKIINSDCGCGCNCGDNCKCK
jgi:nicotinamidase/pyrazinamidase